MFQNVDFSYTNSYDEEKMFKIINDRVDEGYDDELAVIINVILYGDDNDDEKKTALDIINYYIGNHYKFYMNEDDIYDDTGFSFDLMLDSDENLNLNTAYYKIIAGYLIFINYIR